MGTPSVCLCVNHIGQWNLLIYVADSGGKGGRDCSLWAALRLFVFVLSWLWRTETGTLMGVDVEASCLFYVPLWALHSVCLCSCSSPLDWHLEGRDVMCPLFVCFFTVGIQTVCGRVCICVVRANRGAPRLVP